PLELTRFLKVAIALAAVLRQVHQRGLIHKDIKPTHLLVDPSGNVWLTGFGIASLLPRERQAPAPPEIIAGTFAYMAPEQTGRMNRSIDARSDLYSLGVTLYELLTGVLPFTASDPMEWVHCHIARQPTPPGERIQGLPDPIGAIILKLLAKTAEDRYQTAAGVEADLRLCLGGWETHHRIDPFRLAVRDAPDRLLIPEKLYGREAEIETLISAFDRVVAHGTTELLLVSGYAGIGKSSIVNELHKALVPSRGLFAAGKFDQYKRNIPYATLAQAFQSLIRQLLSKNDAELGRWRDALLEALGPNGQLMVNLIPELIHVIGDQPPVPELPPRDAQSRFQQVFRRFLAVFARPEHPLALFLDDLQWMDMATLELLERLTTDPEVRHLLLVCAYRDNEVGPAHPLMRALEAIRGTAANVKQIVLAPLLPSDVRRLVADALHTDQGKVQPLAELVFEKTGGNPFFAIQFVTALAEESLLSFNPDAAVWHWDMNRIRAKRITANVAELMAGKLNRLPTVALNVLQQLACLGNNARASTLTMLLGMPEDAIRAALWEAVRTGLVLRPERGAYSFLHDRVQEAAYALIPETERAAVHLRIGRVLAAQTAPEELEENIFEIVNQLDRGAALIHSLEERRQVAELNLMAGKRAKASAAYASALSYFAAGSSLLAGDSWALQYRLMFELERHRAECEFLTGDLPAAEERLSALSGRVVDLVDRAVVARLRLTLYTTLDRTDRGVEVGLEYLRHVGIELSPHPPDGDVDREFERMRQRLGDRSIEQLLDLPLMSDANWLATMDVLTELLPPARFTDNNLHDLTLLRMTNLSLEHGNCDASCHAYAVLNIVLGLRLGDYQTGFRFGQLGRDLVDKRGLERFKARVYMALGAITIPWTMHVLSGRVLIKHAFDIANAMGDLTYAVYSFKNLVTNLLISGESLQEVQQEAEQALAFARKARFGLYIDVFIDQLMLIRELRGLEPDIFRPEDSEPDDRWFEKHLDEGGRRLALAASWYWIHRMQARFLAQDYSGSVAAAAKAHDLLWATRSHLEIAEYHFYGALTRAAACDSASGELRDRHMNLLLTHHHQIAIWAKSCPANFANRAALVGAEIARLEGRELDAMRLYEEAIQLARQYGFTQNEGIANELASRFYRARGFQTSADAYLLAARACYLRWGADGKVRLLDRNHPQLRPDLASSRPESTIGTTVERLDLATMVKVSQAVSSEIDLPKLIDTFMVLALEQAGADRALLILSRGEELRIVAEGTTIRDSVEVHLRQAPVAPEELPESVLRYVVRTRDSLLLDDASNRNPFSGDKYIRRNRSRSILCLPLIKQAKLTGILYLENRLTSHVFTPARIAVLRLLASQAAISLENARLFADLQYAEAYLAESQRLAHMGSFAFNSSRSKLFWSEEIYRIYEIDRETAPSFEVGRQRTHPDEVSLVEKIVERVIQG
ncbi:MAG: AAA family ATPase, partial [Hypericibacter sp.]